MKKPIILLLIILALTLGLRIPNLPRAMANDEYNIFHATKNLIENGNLEYLNLKTDEPGKSEVIQQPPFLFYAHPPLEPLATAAFYLLPFSPEVSLRLLMLICGVISVFLIYLIARDMYGEKTGLMAAFLAAISVHMIFHYSFRITKDAMVGTLALLAFYYYFKYLKQQKSS